MDDFGIDDIKKLVEELGLADKHDEAGDELFAKLWEKFKNHPEGFRGFELFKPTFTWMNPKILGAYGSGDKLCCFCLATRIETGQREGVFVNYNKNEVECAVPINHLDTEEIREILDARGGWNMKLRAAKLQSADEAKGRGVGELGGSISKKL